jgi:pimeloyl-ACP methyl ester carboxylesterase
MAKKIPGATVAVIAGAGHAPVPDQPDAFDQAWCDFLQGLPG